MNQWLAVGGSVHRQGRAPPGEMPTCQRTTTATPTAVIAVNCLMTIGSCRSLDFVYSPGTTTTIKKVNCLRSPNTTTSHNGCGTITACKAPCNRSTGITAGRQRHPVSVSGQLAGARPWQITWSTWLVPTGTYARHPSVHAGIVQLTAHGLRKPIAAVVACHRPGRSGRHPRRSVAPAATPATNLRDAGIAYALYMGTAWSTRS